MAKQPHILVSNDDGYLAPGLLALVNAVRPLGRITVIAPEQNHSGASNSLTLSRHFQFIALLVASVMASSLSTAHQQIVCTQR